VSPLAAVVGLALALGLARRACRRAYARGVEDGGRLAGVIIRAA
jgi:hypothetical protein